MIKFFKELFKDIIDQSWTLLGMAVAWLVLEGSARDVTGMLILITLGVWVLTFRIRNPKEDDDSSKEPKVKKTPKKAAFNPKAKDGDKDGLVQDGTVWERKAPTNKK